MGDQRDAPTMQLLLAALLVLGSNADAVPWPWSMYDDMMIPQIRTSAPNVEILEDRPPVFLVPPLTGSWIDVKEDHAKEPHWFCRKNKGWHKVWPPAETAFIPGFVDCFGNDMRLEWNETAHDYMEPPGVEGRANSTLDSIAGLEGVYSVVVQMLQTMGYTLGDDIRGLPYDWRFGAKTYLKAGGDFDALQTGIEKMYSDMGGQRVMALSMSMGAPWFNLFLLYHVDQEWKDKYIASHIALSGPFTGAPVAAEAQITSIAGWSSHSVPMGTREALLEMARSYGSVSWMAAIVRSKIPLVTTVDGRAWNVDQLDELYELVGANNTAEIFRVQTHYPVYASPNVTTYAFYGYGLPTACSYEFNANLTNATNVTYCDGDGVATLDSLQVVPAAWNTSAHPSFVQGFFNATHGGTLSDPRVLGALANVLSGKYHP